MKVNFALRLPELKEELAKFPGSYRELSDMVNNYEMELSEYEKEYLAYVNSLSLEARCKERELCVEECTTVYIEMDEYISSRAFQKFFEMPYEEFEADTEVIETQNKYKALIVASEITVAKCSLICKAVPDDVFKKWKDGNSNG